ncbi:hypothetical protein SCB71_02290 [Herbiconiux sp. KACC 21604]|uniref:hypothetical protein n=1 Tax=unclassified Herbiconiux TaxID=2618217 RepID=UPI001491A281|nr:hypothetical protein [Herbiconiux sp. SALV-R1]QJU52243.1 hypothetical protein HL652_00270 [Herbiconiux sp. SALV-R1]WPO87088.1 hypothetical protein SCB71_02290 [Herbiconiux sp. KACC 21604]
MSETQEPTPPTEATPPTAEQLEASEHTEKRTVAGETRYYVKDLEKHLRIWGHPNPNGLVAYFTPEGTFHADGVDYDHRRALIGMMGGIY